MFCSNWPAAAEVDADRSGVNSGGHRDTKAQAKTFDVFFISFPPKKSSVRRGGSSVDPKQVTHFITPSPRPLTRVRGRGEGL